MANPLFQALGAESMEQIPGPMGDMMSIIQQFKQFRSTFQGDPKAEVMKLLQSGQISQQQLSQLQSMATQFSTLVKD